MERRSREVAIEAAIEAGSSLFRFLRIFLRLSRSFCEGGLKEQGCNPSGESEGSYPLTGRNEVISVGLQSSGKCSQEDPFQLSASVELRGHQSGVLGPDPL